MRVASRSRQLLEWCGSRLFEQWTSVLKSVKWEITDKVF